MHQKVPYMTHYDVYDEFKAQFHHESAFHSTIVSIILMYMIYKKGSHVETQERLIFLNEMSTTNNCRIILPLVI